MAIILCVAIAAAPGYRRLSRRFPFRYTFALRRKRNKMLTRASKKKALAPRFVRLDASTVCQLKCPSCPTATGTTGQKLGVGSLRFEDFKHFIRGNPQVAHIEL